ncbi:hypothetical protein Vretimale_8315 [Volvox reticuliferus]|uniref:LysM domain-containing protein n=1 Tax=Volvox reticuliferus TaxID=1737510 RepID=A0A8J4GAM9_9CHLO|nr:hypothetical protein Vretimale_8315 [Volvox reticuliferus]
MRGLCMHGLLISDTVSCNPNVAVCTLWREAASSTEVRRAAFMQHWRLAGLVGSARNPMILDTAALGHFVRRHVVRRGDTLTGLAVCHGCEVTTIMRLNNLISYHSLHSREDVFLPGERA